MENPIISVVIPSYQQGRYLREALDSLINQTLINWEAIIVNDGSTDETESVAKEYLLKDKRIRYISQANSGVSSARNNGIRQSFGRYILPLDADDKIATTYLEKGVKYLTDHPDYAVYTCKAQLFGDESGVWNVHYSGYANLLVINGVHNTSIYHKSDWERIGGYDESFKTGQDDWEFMIRLLYHNDKVHEDKDTLFYYRIVYNRNHLTTIASNNRIGVESQLFKKHFDKYVEFYGNPLANLREYLDLKQWSLHRLPTILKKSMLKWQKIHDNWLVK